MFRDKAIRNTHPTVVTIRGNGSTAVDTNGDVVVLDESLISTEMARLQAEYDSQEYARDRVTEYPSTGDQLDMLWHAIDTGDWTAAKVKLTSFYTELKAVKDKYPKE